jgi:hypothetical protein
MGIGCVLQVRLFIYRNDCYLISSMKRFSSNNAPCGLHPCLHYWVSRNVSIVRYSKEDNVSEDGSVSIVR